ncbi:MAG: radical SAM protein [Planctomycetota bacterium]
MGPTGRSRIVQIHPTRRCNLRCRHCYSSSGPEERDALDAALLRAALDDAAELGYGVISLSGGEPLMYPGLVELLDHGKERGFLNTFTTNGMLLTDARLDELRDRVDLMAVSLDGIPDSHDAIRGQKGAFDAMRARLDGLRASGIPFGFLFTLTQANVHELEWVAEFAREQGARLLQVHPLEEEGRARDELAGFAPDTVESAMAHLETLRIRGEVDGQLSVQLDLVNQSSLKANPELVYAGREPDADAPLSERISPLIVEASGELVPLQYGFAREYSLGNLHEGRLADHAERWIRDVAGGFEELCRAVHRAALADTAPPYFNWFDIIGRASHAAVRERLAV